MWKIAGAAGLGAALTTSCLVAAAGPTAADPARRADPYPPSALVLAIGAGEDASTSVVQQAVTLNCRPSAGGTHPAPGAACGELRAVGGQFAALPHTRGATGQCTKEYRPVAITAVGVWDGRRVSYEHTFPNRCVLKDSVSRVFDF